MGCLNHDPSRLKLLSEQGENGLRGFTVDKINLFGATINFLDPVNKYYVLMVFAATATARGLGMQIW